jgi:tetratricopeptide (TPR) repeat protein
LSDPTREAHPYVGSHSLAFDLRWRRLCIRIFRVVTFARFQDEQTMDEPTLTLLLRSLKQRLRRPKSTESESERAVSLAQWQLHPSAREIQNLIAGGSIAKARALCDDLLAKAPGDPLLEGLRLQILNKDRMTRLEYTQAIGARLANVADLDTRVMLLQHALLRYPNESQLCEMLKTATAQRDLITSMIAQARDEESAGRYAEALQQWFTVRECYPDLPKLKSQIQRLVLLRVSQLRSARKATLIREITRLLRVGEYERAVAQCGVALAEFPNDADLLAARADVERKAGRAAEIQQVVVTGVSYFHDRRLDDAIKAFRTAAELDGNDEQVRDLLAMALLEKVQIVLDEDWRQARQLFSEAARLVPHHSLVKSLREAIRERRAAASDVGTDDEVPEADSVTVDVAEPVELAGFAAPAAPQAQQTPASHKPSFRLLCRRSMAAMQAHLQAFYLRLRYSSSRGPLITVVLLVLLVVSLSANAAWYFIASDKPAVTSPLPVAAVPSTLEIRALPDGAEIFIDGRKAGESVVRSQLADGEYSVVVSKPGYTSQTVPVKLDAPRQTVDVTLQALPMDLQIVSDQPAGTVWLDQELKGELARGELLIPQIRPGIHELIIKTSKGQALAAFEMRAGSPATPVSLPQRRLPAVFFIGSTEKNLRMDCNCVPTDVRAGGSTVPLKAGGVELESPAAGSSLQLALWGGKKLIVEGSAKPRAIVAAYWNATTTAPRPSSTDALISEATLLMNNRRYEAALAKLKEALARDPRNDQVPILEKRIRRMMILNPN